MTSCDRCKFIVLSLERMKRFVDFDLQTHEDSRFDPIHSTERAQACDYCKHNRLKLPNSTVNLRLDQVRTAELARSCCRFGVRDDARTVLKLISKPENRPHQVRQSLKKRRCPLVFQKPSSRIVTLRIRHTWLGRMNLQMRRGRGLSSQSAMLQRTR